MTTTPAIRLGSVAVAALVLIGGHATGSGTTSGETSASAALSATEPGAPASTEPSASGEVTPTPDRNDTSVWLPFVSERYGFSIAYPPDWEAHPANGEWTFPDDTAWPDGVEHTDWFYLDGPDGGVAASAWSVVLGPGTSADEWFLNYCAVEVTPCDGTEPKIPASLDGHAGWFVPSSDPQAYFGIGDRIYLVVIWQPEDHPALERYGGGRQLLEMFLSTMRLLPRTEAPTSSLPEMQDIEKAGALAIDTSGNADWVTIAGASAWVANVPKGIIRFDLATGDMLSEIPTNDICLAMDEGFGSLWAGDCVDNTLLRIDVATGELVATIDLPFASIPGESSVAVGEDGVWMLSTGTQPDLVRIDPATNEVADIFPAPSDATAVRAGDGSLWITRAHAGQLLRVDPATGEELAEIDVAAGSTFLAYGEGGVWTLGSTGEVVRVDPATNSVVAIIPTGGPVAHGDIAVGGGYVWARTSESLFAQIDPATDTVVARYGPPSEGSGGIDADDQAVWVSDYLAQTVWRLPLD